MGVTLSGTTNPVTSVNRRNTALGLGCVAAFLVPFGAVGAGAAIAAVRHLIQGDLHQGLPQLLFGVVFGGVAAGGWTLLLIGRGKLRELESLKARHPGQPWLWRSDWASGRISDSSRALLWSSWIFATLWNLISCPSAFLGFRAATLEGNKFGYIALLFPLAGAGLLSWAIRNSLRHTKFGVSLLQLSTIPGTIGHSLAGTVRVASLLQPAEGFALTLSCVHRVTTQSGKDSSTSETILWQEDQQVRGETSRDSAGMATRIPVGFRIPADARGSDATNSNDQIVWRLSVAANVPGIDYLSLFEVPVFRTGASDLPPTQQDLSLGDRLNPAEYRQPRDSRITVSRSIRGTEIVFPAARNPGAAISLTLFSLLWGASIALMLYLKAPLLFPIVFGLFGLLLLIGMLQLWFEVSRVVAERGSVSVASGYLYPGREQTIASGEVAEITTRIGMQAGSRPYYDLMILSKRGKRIIAGRSIRNKREAEWLAVTLQQALGLNRVEETRSREAGALGS
jgi:hypothetical protein